MKIYLEERYPNLIHEKVLNMNLYECMVLQTCENWFID